MSNPLFSFDSMHGRNNLSIASLAEIKFVITSVVVPQSTSKFAALIKNANDSETFNASLENKSICSKNDLKNIHLGDMSAVDENDGTHSDVINVNNVNVIGKNTSDISGENEPAGTVPMDISNESYTNLEGCVTSSTPVKLIAESDYSETYKLNLHTPPDDASFIDSDPEPIRKDECNNPDDNSETLKCNDDNANGITPKDFFFKKPLQSTIRRHKKILQEKFFTHRRKKKSRLQYEKRSSEYENIYDSDSSRSVSPMSRYKELGCKPLLVTENVKRFCDNAEWDDNFDFSFVCEPSTSDIENDDECVDANFNSLNISTYNLQAACVPTFRITGPDDLSRNFKEASVHILRRSISNPSSMCDLLNKSADMTYEHFVEAAVRLEGTTTHSASVRNLDTLSVSF